MTLIYSLEFVGAVLAIAFFAWLIRSLVESEPDPLLLNLTFFAFAGQCVLTAELMGEGKSIRLIFWLDVLAFILVFIQARLVMAHASVTIEHYERLLRDNKADNNKIEFWAVILLRITGVDFFPEFYQEYINIWFLRNTPEHRRIQAASILPPDLFQENKHRIDAEALKVETANRVLLWRLYVAVCLAAWLLFIICIVVGGKHL